MALAWGPRCWPATLGHPPHCTPRQAYVVVNPLCLFFLPPTNRPAWTTSTISRSVLSIFAPIRGRAQAQSCHDVLAQYGDIIQGTDDMADILLIAIAPSHSKVSSSTLFVVAVILEAQPFVSGVLQNSESFVTGDHRNLSAKPQLKSKRLSRVVSVMI